VPEGIAFEVMVMGSLALSDSIQSYLYDINRFPVLSQEEELKIAERYYREKGLDDAKKLVTSNLRYVVKIALEYRNYGCRIADLIQEGNIGLMVAVKKFNPYKGFRLITYATWWIRSFIQDFILKTTGLVKRGSKALKRKLFYKKDHAEEGLSTRDRTDENDAYPYELSLDNPIADDGRTTHLDMLCDTRPGQEETASVKEEQALAKREIKNALSSLNDKERFVIENRVMADPPESLQDLGDRLGLTRERVRQIEAQALKKLEKTLAPMIISPSLRRS
jgi:RNA polymerase sigma-32 factor